MKRTDADRAMPALAFLPSDPPSDPSDFPQSQSPSDSSVDEGLGYRVEIWNDDETSVEAVLAIARTAAIAYSAFFEAAKHLPHRLILLRFEGRTLSRWKVGS
jgi:hypothetical protein